MAKGTILVVEDEEDILELITFNLLKDGYKVERARTGEDALVKARHLHPDLVVLDIMLPGVDGLEVCRAIKGATETAHIPVVMLTAKTEESDIVSGLELGADDYVTKPFSPRVLLARIKSVIRRTTASPDDAQQPLALHEISINSARHEVRVAGVIIPLTVTEFRVLQFLSKKPGWVFSRSQIVEAVRGDGYPVTDRSVDVQIVGLRRKLGDAGKYIETVRGVGYRFKE
ncbi:MAG: response regulator [Ignavibacteria bacterium]|nr:response regulator [Ignavibacteria bacterium]